MMRMENYNDVDKEKKEDVDEEKITAHEILLVIQKSLDFTF